MKPIERIIMLKALLLYVTRRRTKVRLTVEYTAPSGITADRIREMLEEVAENAGVRIIDLHFDTVKGP